MAQKTEMQAIDHNTQNDHIGDDEVSELQRSPNSFYVKVREQAERFACTRFGQMVIERVDRGLKLIEDTTKWSLPIDTNSSVVLERPLPWAPFLMLIIVLRLVRIWLSVGAFLIGNGPISPLDMIYFIQTRRRKLRAIRVHGLRTMRQTQLAASSVANGTSFTQKMSEWFNRAICRPGVQQANNYRLVLVNRAQQQNNQVEKIATPKRSREKDSNIDHNLTIDEMLAKYAHENSEEDSDFVPSEENGSAASSESTSDLSDTDSHSSEQISSDEEQIMAATHEEITPTMKVNQAKLITVNGSNGVNEQMELVPPAAAPQPTKAPEDDQWKSSPGHLSAALTTTRNYNNIAAAVNTEPPTSNPYTPHTISQPVNDSDNDNDNDNNDSDCDTDETVCQQQQLNGEHNATATLIHDLSYPNPEHPTVDTLTPATSSEDIFYSPIGSPNNFNSSLGTQALLKNAAIIAAPNHSTPYSEQDEIYSAGSEIENQSKPSIAEQHDSHSSGKPFKQQQQRQFNHSHQRFRGRNRR